MSKDKDSVDVDYIISGILDEKDSGKEGIAHHIARIMAKNNENSYAIARLLILLRKCGML